MTKHKPQGQQSGDLPEASDQPVQQIQVDESQLRQQVQVDESQTIQHVQVDEPATSDAIELPVKEDEMNPTATAETTTADDGLISDELAKPLEVDQTQTVDETPTSDQTPAAKKSLTVDPTPPVDDSLYRPEWAATAAVSQSTPSELEQTRVQELSEEERKLAAERAARRRAREEALAAPDQVAPAPPKPVVVTKRTTDRFVGGLGLFLLRLVVAAILAVRGLELVMNIPAAQEMFAQTRIPQPEIMAIVTGISALAIALALVFGLLVRVAGLGVVLIAGGALAFVQWGNWSPFVAGRPGFLGEFELLLAAVGLLLVCVGGGGFGLDRSFRLSRERSKAAKEPVSA